VNRPYILHPKPETPGSFDGGARARRRGVASRATPPRAPQGLPTPHTLYPTPHTLHPTPCTLHTTPYTLHPRPTPTGSAYTPHSIPHTLLVARDPKPYTINPEGRSKGRIQKLYTLHPKIARGGGSRATLPRVPQGMQRYTPPPPYTLHPTPYTLHPTPYTLHPTPHTPHPTPYTLHPTPYTLHPTPHTPHPTPHTQHPKPYTLNPKP
jgi:hypothetical protein